MRIPEFIERLCESVNTIAEAQAAMGEATLTIKRLNEFEVWLETSSLLADKTDVGPRTGKEALHMVLQEYRKARYP